MKRIGVADLKDQLSKYLRLAEGGIEVEVTDRDRPIARIVPIKATRRVAAEPSKRPFMDVRTRRYPAAGWPRGSTVLLLEERQER